MAKVITWIWHQGKELEKLINKFIHRNGVEHIATPCSSSSVVLIDIKALKGMITVSVLTS